MKPALKIAFDAEMAAAIHAYRRGRFDRSFSHLETAHVLGQRHVLPHVVTHWWMFKIGVKRHSVRETSGQAVRIVLGALGSAVGFVPTGNTGGTNIGMFKRLPVDRELQDLLR